MHRVGHWRRVKYPSQLKRNLQKRLGSIFQMAVNQKGVSVHCRERERGKKELFTSCFCFETFRLLPGCSAHTHTRVISSYAPTANTRRKVLKWLGSFGFNLATNPSAATFRIPAGILRFIISLCIYIYKKIRNKEKEDAGAYHILLRSAAFFLKSSLQHNVAVRRYTRRTRCVQGKEISASLLPRMKT